MALTLKPVAWIRDGAQMGGGEPIQFEVQGLPHGQEALIGYPPHWKVLRRGPDVHGTWRGDFETPEMALKALEQGLAGPRSLTGEWKSPITPSRSSRTASRLR
jgi:hypothetical protein